ncbi:MAG: CaiB/BaiF CoA transferase family protein [Dehalococcoidia bacterium]
MLEDLRVIDLSNRVSGSYASKLLASLGAYVIKVEKPNIGDRSRSIGPFMLKSMYKESSLLFKYLNIGKKSITLDITTTTGRKIFQDLLSVVDIVIDDSNTEILVNTICISNPSIILSSISDFGKNGPYGGFKGNDLINQGLSGLLQTMGLPSKEPLKVGGNSGEYAVGISMFSGILISLLFRDSSVLGNNIVETSGLQTLALAQIHNSINSQFRGEDNVRRDSPLLKAKNGWVTMGLATGSRDDTWHNFCQILEMPELINDSRFSSMELRRKNESELNQILEEWVLNQDKEEIYHKLQNISTIAGYVAEPEDLLHSDQLLEREFFNNLDGMLYPGIPFLIDNVRPSLDKAPLLGENNIDIYCDLLGYKISDVSLLHQSGVV